MGLELQARERYKILARPKRKGCAEDLQKALWYLKREIQAKGGENEEGE
jgi:hypothetical protein